MKARPTPLAVLACLAAAAPARAFTIESGFSDPCHERITAEGFLLARDAMPSLDEAAVPDGPWERLAERFAPAAAELPRAERFFLFSVILGVRSPDNEGHSVTNLTVLRSLHSDPEGQYIHCLRAARDDYYAGNESALDGCRAALRESLDIALEAFRADPNERIEEEVTLDGYGTFSIEVSRAGYHLGRALHTLEDSFTHTLRAPDLHRVVHLMNFEAAIAGHLREHRDGMAHSAAADSCRALLGSEGGLTNHERVFGAVDAVADLTRAFWREAADPGAGAIEGVQSKWLELAEPTDLGEHDECVAANDYCDSPWLDVARLEPAKPILGCRVGTAASPDGVTLLLALSLLAIRGRRGR